MTVKELNLPKNESLEDFIKRDQIKQQLRENVKVWTEQYCDAITENYKEYHIRSLTRNSSLERPDLSDYAKQQLAEIEDGTANLMKFRVEIGRKYLKVIQRDERNGEYRDGSVHAFVERSTGNVYKAASWKAPAKHVRYNLLDDNSRNVMFVNLDWAGGYLYMR